MANSHIQPSMMAETQAICGDLLAPAILATSLVTPGSGMTLPAFATYGYVRNGSPTRLVYVHQAAAAVTLAGSPGAYWLALMHDTYSDVAAWTRQAGTHYCWQAAATQPADPPGGLVMAGVTVAGAHITAVDPNLNYPATKVAYGGSNGQLAFSSALTWNGVALHVGGTVESRVHATYDYAGDNAVAFYSTLNAAGGTSRWFLYGAGTAASHLGGTLTVNGATTLASTLVVSGAVGIQRGSDPAYSLATAGAIFCAGGITGQGNFNLVGSAAVGANLSVAGATTLSGAVGIQRAFDPSYALATAGAIFCGGALTAATTLYVGGALTVQSTLTLAGTATIGGNLTVTGTTSMGGNLTVTGTAAALSGNLTVAGTTVFSSYVGIGMTPAYRLDANAPEGIRMAGPVGLGVAPNPAFQLDTGTVACRFGGTVGIQLTPAYDFDVLGTALGIRLLGAVGIGLAPDAVHQLKTADAPCWFGGRVGVKTPPGYDFDLDAAVAGARILGAVGYGMPPDASYSIRLALDAAGKPGGGSWINTTSFRALKDQITDLTGALDVLGRLRPRVWRWRDEAQEGHTVGFVVEEVAEDLPAWVPMGADGPLGVQERGAVAYLVQAIQELARRLKAVEEKAA